MNLIYKEIIFSKDNYRIPVFINDKAMHSKYAPVKEAESFALDSAKDCRFTIIAGLGGGYHIEQFLKRNPENFVVAVEKSEEDIKFLSEIECVKNLLKNKSVLIISQNRLFETIIKNYLPQFYGGLNLFFNRAWHDFNTDSADYITETVNSALSQCSKDISVQSHFGLIWQKNIIKNLKVLSNLKVEKFVIDNTKKAAVIAAGPSLDKTIDIIKEKRNEYFLIATDTAFSTIKKYKLKCDAVVSIDGQNISHKHFIGQKDCGCIYVFDLQANNNAVNYIKTFTDKIIFTKSGHPFCDYAELNGLDNESFLHLKSGAGTVTIAAVDFASKCGFETVELFGADFSYIFNKPYTRGTYLDSLYRINETKKTSAESQFTNLIYRTPVKKSELESFNTTQIKTEVLNSYRESFIEWINSNNYCFTYDKMIYSIYLKKKEKREFVYSTPCFNFTKLTEAIKKDSETLQDINYKSPKDLNNLALSLLPLIANLKNTYKNQTFVESLKLALTKILEYT
ncbi:MAG: motility associated factor glycosyltransferase family protein [Treponema sp.]|uniref:6-hydroxymethylpterin diphosphokinase MptE-like protein n=1 Tax=Treponema sp. TaxID=166 RepID=UPI001B72DDCE|nr:6-hydroxymethylpterin diphosphokinase MptE-like protein [Treponema sp.]MBP5402485.1 motility associated factor glycosyltransferase family protein [Treponema sp.]MBR5933105.1 motility associated factor glycosyltransferase family protein [Treponema sp.]